MRVTIDGRFAEIASSITVYHLPTKKNKLPFSVSFCNKQRKFSVSFLRLQQTNDSFRFPSVPFYVCGILEKWRHGHGDMETWQHRHETWKHGDIDMRHRNIF